VGTATRADHERANAVPSSGELHSGEIDWRDNQGINRQRPSLSPEQKQRIKELYAETGNGHMVAKITGLGSTTIYKHLALRKSTHPKWTDDQIQVLVDGYLEKIPVKEIAKRIGRSPRSVTIKMCRYRKEVKTDPKKRRALSAITMAFKAVRKADIFREMER
jgi:transposase